MVTYTLLVNELLAAMPQRPEFAQWKQRGTIAREAVRIVLTPLKTDPTYADLPKRFFSSAELLVCYVYKSWLALQKRRYWKLVGKQRWLQVIEDDLQSLLTDNFSLESVQSKAHQILEQAHKELEKQPQRFKKKGKKSRPLFGYLLDLYGTTADKLERRAIGHLLHHDLKVSDTEDFPETIQFSIDQQQVEIARLKEQLQSRLPDGRDPTQARFLEKLRIATALPESELEEFDEEHFSEWRTQKQIPLFNPLPYPILFGSSGDLHWKLEPQKATTEANISPEVPTARSERVKERIQVRFKGDELQDSWFKLQCDRRQLPIFRQFVTDYLCQKQAPDHEKFGEGLFTLRSACLVWKEDPQGARKRKKRRKQGACQDEPWETHRLYLHCTIDTRFLTQEGTEQVRATKLDLAQKALEGIENKTALETVTQEPSAEQQKHLKRKQTTVHRLETQKPPVRPTIQPYEGKSNIVVGVSLSRHEPVTLIVFDTAQNKVLECMGTQALLKIHGIQSPRKNRSIGKLQQEQSQLLRRWRRKRKQNPHRRADGQRQDNYRSGNSESKLGDYLDRLIAARLVALATKRQASVIVLPELGDIRESVECSLQAKAQRKYPQHKKLQAKYAKHFRHEFHRWSYGRLQQYIAERATQQNLALLKGRQPKQGTEQEKVLEIISSACL
jgi:hypothetical protein